MKDLRWNINLDYVSKFWIWQAQHSIHLRRIAYLNMTILYNFLSKTWLYIYLFTFTESKILLALSPTSSILFLFLSLSPCTSNLTPNNFGLSSSSSSFFELELLVYIPTKSMSSLHFFFMLTSSKPKTLFSFLSLWFSSTRMLYPEDKELLDEDLWSSSDSFRVNWAIGRGLFIHDFLLRIWQSCSLRPLWNLSLQNSQRVVEVLRKPYKYIIELRLYVNIQFKRN